MRSLHLMSRKDTAILVVDIQEKLFPMIAERDQVLANCRLVLKAANALNLRVVVTEQYPKGLGHTIAELADLIQNPAIEKLTFSCCGEEGLVSKIGAGGIKKVLLIGIEAHVCVQQTAFDLLANGFDVYLAIDAVGSRHANDKNWALQRMQKAGVSLTTAESAVFEWTERSGTTEFKTISQLIKESDALRAGS